jgi:propionyl-CoA carboxylase beta chain
LSDPLERTDPALDFLVPANPNHTYDMKVLIYSILDGAEFLEIQAHFARNILCGFGRLGGQTVGLIANQPAVLAGVLDINASAKAARFVRFCDAFNIPLVCLVDVPGFMPGPEQEYGGIIRHGAKLLYAFRRGHRSAHNGHPAQGIRRGLHRHELEAHRQRYQLCLAYGGDRRHGAQGSRGGHLPQADRHRRRPGGRPGGKNRALPQDLLQSSAAKRGYIDDVIFPRNTRQRLIRSLQFLESKQARRPERKHGNIPL